MGTTAEKGQRVLQSIAEVQEGINNLGGNLTDQTPFKNFRAELDSIYNNLPKTSYAEGSNITLSNTLKGKLDFEDGIVGYGQTEQKSYEGYNLVPFPYSSQAGTIANVNWTVNSDGTINASGTADNTSSIFYLTNGDDDIYLDADTYKISTNLFTLANGFDIQVIKIVNGSYSTVYTSDMVLTERTRLRVRAIARANTTVNVQKGYLMIEKGSTAHDYEPYVGGIASPNPSYPQDIEVVRGKNRVDWANVNYTGQNGATITRTGSEYSVTSAGQFAFAQFSQEDLKLKPNTNYVFRAKIKSTETSNGSVIRVNPLMTVTGSEIYSSRTTSGNIAKIAFTTPSTIPSNAAVGLYPYEVSKTTVFTDIMICEGTDVATSYLPYNTIEVVERGKNEFKPTLTYDNTTIRATNCSVSLNEDEFTFTATGADMRFGDIISTGSFQNMLGYLIEIPENATNVYLLTTNNEFDKCFVGWYDSNKVALGFQSITTSKAIQSGAKYCNFRIGKNSSVSGTSYKTKIMVAFSSIDTYEPYQTPQTYQLSLGQYEFAKIGNYVDTIEYDVDEDKVYKNEKIGDKTFTGANDENWSSQQYGTNSYSIGISDIMRSTDDTSPMLCLSNLFRGVPLGERTTAGNNIIYSDGASNGIYIRNTTYTSVSDFKTMLSTNNLSVRYVKVTPTLKEITTTLKDQIKALYNSHSFTGTTIIEIDGQLPLIIKVRALKGE